MKNWIKTTLTSLVASAVLGGAAMAETTLNVVAPWSNLNAYGKVEQPFWTKQLPELSGGKLNANLSNYSDLGLSGAELLRMSSMGVFDVAHIVVGYSVSDDPVIEGIELAGLFQDMTTLRTGIDAYVPTMEKDLRAKHNLVYLGIYPNPSQVMYCRDPITKLDDVKGRKVRYYGTSMNDFIQAAGGNGVNVALAEVIPALQRGVVDCGVTGTLTGYSYKWPEVTKHLYSMRLGWGLTLIAANATKFDALSAEDQAALRSATKTLETEIWKQEAFDDKAGLQCDTNGECPYGPNGNMTLTEPSQADEDARSKILQEVVLKKWAARCTADCVTEWNQTVGKVTGLVAQK